MEDGDVAMGYRTAQKEALVMILCDWVWFRQVRMMSTGQLDG